MDVLMERRFLEDVDKLSRSIQKGTILLVDKISQRVGRIKERYPSISRYYEIDLALDQDEKKVTTIHCRKQPIKETRDILTGCYVIETSHEGLSAEAVWRLYTTLTKVEDAFRALKTDLGFRPVHHQIARRTEAHLFISVLAYHLLISIEYQLQQQGDNRRWSTIKTVLSTHQRTTVVLTDEQEQIHSIRLSGSPETAHREIYTRLNISNPLKRIHTIIGKRL
jgi:transposase